MIKKTAFKTRDEWLQARRNYIGGSDAAAVMGLNPWKSNVELWREKTGRADAPDISEKPVVKYGTQAEQHLRELFKLDFPEYSVEHDENNMFTNSDYPFAHASLDGVLIDKDGRRGILEIKTSEIVRSMQREKWRDQVPDNYYLQLLHYLAVTGYDFAILKAQLRYTYDDDVFLHTKHYKIERADVAEDIAILMQHEAEFWQHVQADKEPALLLPSI